MNNKLEASINFIDESKADIVYHDLFLVGKSKKILPIINKFEAILFGHIWVWNKNQVDDISIINLNNSIFDINLYLIKSLSNFKRV